MSGIIWAIGGFLPYGTAIAAVGGIINVVLPVLWNESTVTEQEKIMCEVGNLIDEKIDRYAFNAATAALEGLQRVCSIYNDLVLALKDSQRKKTYHKAAEDIRIMFWNVHSSFSEAIPSFRVPDFETVLLPTYAAAATTHLIVLQDVIKFGKVYGFEEK
ncbi:insecticidal delta-endotoxin Cry8Ea1 family protein, partial [Escherichia sp. SP-MK]